MSGAEPALGISLIIERIFIFYAKPIYNQKIGLAIFIL
jgi:hypothetical protein